VGDPFGEKNAFRKARAAIQLRREATKPAHTSNDARKITNWTIPATGRNHGPTSAASPVTTSTARYTQVTQEANRLPRCAS
jgi:hypothetical protein